MSTLNDRDRSRLNDLQHQLEQDDPTWVRQFTNHEPPDQTRGRLLLDTALGVSVLGAAVGLLLTIPAVVVICVCAAIVLGTIRFQR